MYHDPDDREPDYADGGNRTTRAGIKGANPNK
jgi:hypothetical protein